MNKETDIVRRARERIASGRYDEDPQVLDQVAERIAQRIAIDDTDVVERVSGNA